ncbi:M23 family metallopeptidase [Dactylosporangium aurantiacum]|uniref:M23 family metallopeptidase n=1 Tax=Dactylosporangium aurantiacum TaxID=35754 RepID=A0A9Q9IJJ3_9ACTN|nr:M23 family metallopeptidase [Dactylosporangium aurantiacum]MDG6108355.1 M23 family metallopeptidase [Dactylosporangium aurantiacum]UWZ53895.1 M23 family metallopeptidase [Dactylosporangium aurantiacum]
MNRIRIVCAIGAVVVLLGSGTAGHADARDDKARIDRQIQETQATLEAATERAQQAAADHAAATAALPGAQDALEDAKGRVIAADAAARQAQRDREAADAALGAADAEYDRAKIEVDQGRRDVSAFVAAAYKGSGFAMVNSILESGSPNDLALRISYLDRVAAESQRALDELTVARMAAKQRSDVAELARDQARRAAEQTRQALQDSLAAQAGAEQAAADVRTLIDRSAQAEAVANSERTAVLARYQQLKVDSERVAGELRAAAAAEAAAAARAAKASGRQGTGGAPITTAIPPKTGAFFLMPVHGWKSSNFGMRFDPVYKVYQLHAGIDVAAGGGQPILAAADGKVVRAGWAGGNGNYTCLSHGLYQGKGLATCYAHQSQILVRVGQVVHRGEVIGRVGTTGASTGYHLHFEVRLNGSPVQPLSWLPGCLC